MSGELAKWTVVTLLVLVACLIQWKIAWAMVLITASAALALSEAYGRVEADRRYRKDTEASLLIGRFSEGIVHKGRRTGKIIR